MFWVTAISTRGADYAHQITTPPIFRPSTIPVGNLPKYGENQYSSTHTFRRPLMSIGYYLFYVQFAVHSRDCLGVKTIVTPPHETNKAKTHSRQ